MIPSVPQAMMASPTQSRIASAIRWRRVTVRSVSSGHVLSTPQINLASLAHNLSNTNFGKNDGARVIWPDPTPVVLLATICRDLRAFTGAGRGCGSTGGRREQGIQTERRSHHGNANGDKTATKPDRRTKGPAPAAALRRRAAVRENRTGKRAQRAGVVWVEAASTDGKRRSGRQPSGQGLGTHADHPVRARRGRAAARVAAVAGWQL